MNGWVWCIIPFYAAVLWPELPDLIQHALNADHQTYSMASEVQAMVAMASYSERATREETIDAIKASMPPCHAYLDVLFEFTEKYAGGRDPLS